MAKTPKPKKQSGEEPVAEPKLTAKQIEFLEALKGNLGIVSKAADEVRIHRNTHYNWRAVNPKYNEEVEAIENDCIDVVENALMNNILAGDVASIIFYLKTKAKGRGYVEKTEVDQKTSITANQPIIIDWTGGKTEG